MRRFYAKDLQGVSLTIGGETRWFAAKDGCIEVDAKDPAVTRLEDLATSEDHPLQFADPRLKKEPEDTA